MPNPPAPLSRTPPGASWLLLLLLLRCDPIDGSPPGSAVPGILQARTLEWVAISFSNAGKWKVNVKLLSRVRFLATPWTAAYQAPPYMAFSRKEYWSGVQLPITWRLGRSRPPCRSGPAPSWLVAPASYHCRARSGGPRGPSSDAVRGRGLGPPQVPSAPCLRADQ